MAIAYWTCYKQRLYLLLNALALLIHYLMKKTLLTISFCFVVCLSKAQNTDLPGPTPNLQTLPSGSYVIAMDNSLQINSSGDFNLKAYGLIVYLLNNNVHIKWSIKAGKAKDGIDFTATAEQLKPTLVSGGVSRNFKAGPFVIFASDTSGVASLIDAFYTTNSLTGANRPQVYRLTASAANVDIRYNLTGFRPKAAVLTDGGNQNLHLAYMTAASIPSESYATSQGTDLLSNCFTFASEPHNTKTGTAVNNAISAIKDFVTKGGNFLAQCEAINNYENNTLGRFQTTGGISISNAAIGTTVSYPNADLSYSQFEGNFNESYGGSLKNWQIVGTATNNEHHHATGTGGNSSIIGASVSKHYYDKGGLVFYLGSHSFATTSLDGINGIRMYMDAFLTPSNTNCPELIFSPLALKLTSFSGMNNNNQAKIIWSVANNEQVQQFMIERSVDGKQFAAINIVNPSTKTGADSYQFSERLMAAKCYYRLRIIDRHGGIVYSSVLSFSDVSNKEPYLAILNRCGGDDVQISYFSTKNNFVNFTLYNSSGSKIYSAKAKMVEGTNIVSLPANNFINNRIYYLVAVSDDNKVLEITIPRF